MATTDYDLTSAVVALENSSPEELEFFWWEYDDASNAAIAVNQKHEEVTLSKHFNSKAQRKEFQKKLQASSSRKNIDFEKTKLKITSGLSQLKKIPDQFHPKDAPTEYYKELKNMLFSCGSDQHALQTTVTLFSALLAGYYTRYALTIAVDSSEPLQLHAPIVAVPPRDGTFDALRQMARSVIIDTSPQSSDADELYFLTPPILPTTLTEKRIEDSAALYLSYSVKKYYGDAPLPAQYRDTGVLINTTFYPTREVFNFQLRNPWAATILYGVQQRALLLDPIRLDGKVFSQCTFDWNCEYVCRLILPFVAWLSRNLTDSGKKKEAFLNRYQKMTKLIINHNSHRGTKKYRGIHKIWLTLQLLSLYDLSQFLLEREAISEPEHAHLQAEWFNCLLPGCCPAPVDSAPLEERAILIPERDSQELFELTLSNILAPENLEHFTFVPPKSHFPKTVSSHKIWGYLRNCRNNNTRTAFRGLVLPETLFCTLAKKYAPVRCDWAPMIRAFRKTGSPYLHPTPSMRLTTEKLEPALILDLDKLYFLPESILSHLISQFPEEAPASTE